MGRRDISDPSSWRDLSQTADPSLDEMGEREYAEASDRAELVLERALDPEIVRRRGVEMRAYREHEPAYPYPPARSAGDARQPLRGRIDTA